MPLAISLPPAHLPIQQFCSAPAKHAVKLPIEHVRPIRLPLSKLLSNLPGLALHMPPEGSEIQTVIPTVQLALPQLLKLEHSHMPVAFAQRHPRTSLVR